MTTSPRIADCGHRATTRRPTNITTLTAKHLPERPNNPTTRVAKAAKHPPDPAAKHPPKRPQFQQSKMTKWGRCSATARSDDSRRNLPSFQDSASRKGATPVVPSGFHLESLSEREGEEGENDAFKKVSGARRRRRHRHGFRLPPAPSTDASTRREGRWEAPPQTAKEGAANVDLSTAVAADLVAWSSAPAGWPSVDSSERGGALTLLGLKKMRRRRRKAGEGWNEAKALRPWLPALQAVERRTRSGREFPAPGMHRSGDGDRSGDRRRLGFVGWGRGGGGGGKRRGQAAATACRRPPGSAGRSCWSLDHAGFPLRRVPDLPVILGPAIFHNDAKYLQQPEEIGKLVAPELSNIRTEDLQSCAAVLLRRRRDWDDRTRMTEQASAAQVARGGR
ncbi:hypothetical protein HU200_054935 [Digitaria exilis]|uniref:Uncharacterized protein n=1 Tax=Digitaria exilis TaxID=1010633 RepID=A0A835AEU2_9POAL|nr:hypothetical protein HU200_054935 [Digitaria exilis]